MEKIEIRDVAKETVCVLDYFEPQFISKIPEYVLTNLKELAEKSNIKVIIDRNKELKEQAISEETKDFIALIYYNYIATKEQKTQILEIWNQNELLYQEEIRKKYNPDDIFKKEIVKEEDNLAMVEYKKNIFQKMLEKIKSIFTLHHH